MLARNAIAPKSSTTAPNVIGSVPLTPARALLVIWPAANAIPTPMAIATAMFYTGTDPLTGEKVYSATDLREKRMMKALIFYWDAQHWPLAREALKKAGRGDLIGRAPHCLVPFDDAPMMMSR